MDNSGTIAEKSVYTNHPMHQVALSDHSSSYASLSHRSGQESYGGFSEMSALDVDYNYRDAYWKTDRSLISGAPDDQTSAADEESQCKEFTVVAPKGKLGLTLQTSQEDCLVVHDIKSSSPLADHVQVGDELHKDNGVDVTMVLSDTVARIIASKEHDKSRLLLFARPKAKS